MTKTQIRPVRIDGSFAFITLTRGYEAVIDVADLSLVQKWNWWVLAGSHTTYAMRVDCSGRNRRTVYLHRIIMGDPEGFLIDHRDGNGLNNTRNNLRKATQAQNNRNSRISKTNTSGFKGVSASGRKWRAVIHMNDKQRYLGVFDTPEAAHDAYRAASVCLHGEFGRMA